MALWHHIRKLLKHKNKKKEKEKMHELPIRTELQEKCMNRIGQ